MTLILVYTLSKTILGHSFFNYILVFIKQQPQFIPECPFLVTYVHSQI